MQVYHAKKTWAPLVAKEVVSQDMADKASEGGLSFDDVRRAFARDGEDGARRVLQERTAEGKARVTDRRNSLDSICRHLRDTAAQQ